MNSLDSLLKRNKDFAASQSAARELMPRALPNVKAIIIGCADMRVDPAHVLGIKPGEAVAIRNIGGRITPGLLEQLGLLGRIGHVAEAIPGGGGEFHLIVIQHTDCGSTYLAGDPSMLSLFSNTGRETQEQKSHQPPCGGCCRRRPAPGDSRIAGRLAHIRPGL
jgi:carbonic anhydrase